MRRIIAVTLVLVCSAAFAVTPGTWRHATEKDFTDGEFDSAAVSTRGEIALSRKIQVLMGADEAPAVVSAVVAGRNVIYAASGTTSDIYKIVGAKAVKFAKLPGTIITSMIAAPKVVHGAEGAVLLAAGGGKTCGIYAIDAKGKITPVWSDKSIKYIWAIVPGPGDLLYVATGAKAKVIAITGGKSLVVYEAGDLAKNILCLARRVDGRLYAGTDEKGLVVEIDPLLKSSRIILDAAEKEIAAIIPAPGGGLFVATSDAAKASSDGKLKPATAKSGKSAPTKTKAPKGTEAKAEPAVKASAKHPPGSGPTTRRVAKPTEVAEPTSAPVKSATTKPATTKPSTKIKKRSAKPGGPESAPVDVVKPSSKRRDGSSSGGSAPSGPGNAVYLIEPTGLVRTLFRKPLTILAMLLQGDRLLLATGNGGAIYSMTLDGDVVTRLADTDARQVTALSMSPNGNLVLATANKGSVVSMGRRLAPKGTFISKALDAKQIAMWGTAKCRVVTPAGTKVTLATRSGNLAKPDKATWSDWSEEQSLGTAFIPIGSPAARFLQYRLTLTATDRAKASPMVQELALIYQVGNLAPVIQSVKVVASAKPSPRDGGTGAKVFRPLTITAKDANGDSMIFRIEFRPVGTKIWVQIAKKLAKPAFVWDTRTVSDGSYELRVTASDSPANPPASALETARISEPFTVDNTRPSVNKLTASVVGGKVTVGGEAADATSQVVNIQYNVDSGEDWTPVQPADGICDSQREKFSFRLTDLKPGAHRIAIKVTDLYGNVVYASTTVTLP